MKESNIAFMKHLGGGLAPTWLVKTITDVATLTGLTAGIGWIAEKLLKETFTADPSSNVMNYATFTAVMASSVALKHYLEGQKILQMASVAIIIGGAILNAVAFTGGNYLAKYLSGVDGKAALEEKTRHGKALEAYQVTMAKYFATAPSFLIGSKPTGTSKNKRSRTSRTLITLSNPITRQIQTGKSPR